jgi:1,4-dihydroxy-2-naphthoyl-CoA hydrolase
VAERPTFEVFNAEFAERVRGARSKRGIDAYLGIEVTEFEAGRLVASFEVRDELITMIGNMHGGCMAALVDHCLGVVMYPVMPPGYWAATTEFKVNYLSPVSKGTCTATAEVVSMTRRLAVVRIEVENDGRLVALAQGTCTIVAPKAEQG